MSLHFPRIDNLDYSRAEITTDRNNDAKRYHITIVCFWPCLSQVSLLLAQFSFSNYLHFIQIFRNITVSSSINLFSADWKSKDFFGESGTPSQTPIPLHKYGLIYIKVCLSAMRFDTCDKLFCAIETPIIN